MTSWPLSQSESRSPAPQVQLQGQRQGSGLLRTLTDGVPAHPWTGGRGPAPYSSSFLKGSGHTDPPGLAGRHFRVPPLAWASVGAEGARTALTRMRACSSGGSGGRAGQASAPHQPEKAPTLQALAGGRACGVRGRLAVLWTGRKDSGCLGTTEAEGGERVKGEADAAPLLNGGTPSRERSETGAPLRSFRQLEGRLCDPRAQGSPPEMGRGWRGAHPVHHC